VSLPESRTPLNTMGEVILPLVGHEPKGFMGRIFLTPVKFSIAQGPQFWVNVGFQHWQVPLPGDDGGYVAGSNYILPQWVDTMEAAVSKEAYDALMKDLKEHFDKDPSTLSVLYRYLPGLNGCAPCAIDDFYSEMNAILARHAQRFPGGVGLVYKELSRHVANVPEEQTVDQYGKDLVDSYQPLKRTWPPLGYSVILQIPRETEDRVRAAWPPAAAPGNRQGAAAAIPEPLTIPPAVNSKSYTLHLKP